MRWRSLTRNSQFQKVYREGVKRIGRLLVVYLLPADEYARGIVASRKVGGAVRRNRAKRLLREAMAAGLPGRPEWREEVAANLRTRHPGTAPNDETGGGRNEGSAMNPTCGGDGPDQDETAGLWIVLVARQRILEANMHDVRAELDGLLQALAEE